MAIISLDPTLHKSYSTFPKPDIHTDVVKQLKQIAQNPPPLKLITDGKQILQTYASDESWGAILLEECNGKEHFIAYASGQFSNAQKHYHTVYKEILAMKNGIKKFEFHLIGHRFLIRLDNSVFPNSLTFKQKVVPEKTLLRLKEWFSRYDYHVQHIKGYHNLIPDLLSRPPKSQPSQFFCITSQISFPIIAMASSLPKTAVTQKSFPLNMTFQSPHSIQDFARKFLCSFFMNIYQMSRDITEDELWYTWCLTILLNNPKLSTSLTWTLFKWLSPLPWWRKKLQQIAETHHLLDLPDQEGQQFTSVFIIHRPYFQHPHTRDFWIQNQNYEWMTVPHIACLEQDLKIKTSLKNFFMKLNHIPPDQPEILHTSLGPKHEMFMILTSSLHSQPPNHSQDPYEDFTPVPSPSPYKLGSSSSPYPPFSSQPNQPEHYPQLVPSSPQDIPLPKGQYCPWPCVPGCSHRERIFKKDKDPDRDPDESESSSEDGSISL
ncbi:hypothetical protein WN943_023169 [Citrus x changshan-huyou]